MYQVDIVKIRNCCASKGTTKKVKRQPREWEKKLWIISETCTQNKELLQLNTKKKTD